MFKKIPYVLAVLTMVQGVSISILFGINEDIFKGKIKSQLSQNKTIQSIKGIDARKEKIKYEASKNWRYYQRFHFHSTGIGAMAMTSLLFLLLIQAPMGLKTLSSFCISIGGFLYPYVWLFAGMYGPVMGRGAAKEVFAIFAYMGSVFLLGLVLMLYAAIKHPIREL